MHCDVDIADSAEHIRQVLEDVRVDRVDHGTNVLEKPELVDYMAEHGIGLTSCPISNTWVSDGSKVGLLTELDKRGVKVTVNSDDPAYFGGYIAENYQRVVDEAGVDEETLKRFARNAVDISWAPASLKERIAAEIAAYKG